MTRRVPLGVALIAATACASGNPGTPTVPQTVDASGVWTYTSTVTAASGGECVGSAPLVGEIDSGTISITQTGANLSAVSRSSDGTSCSYTGAAGDKAVTLGWTSCDAGKVLGIHCTNGALRDLLMESNSISATIDGRSATGMQAQSFTVVVSGTTTAVGVLAITAKFSATK